MQKTTKLKYIVVAVFAVIVFLFSSLVGGGAAVVHAATSTKTAYEKSNVWDNLQGAIIGGNDFDIADYPYSENGKPQIITFVEFGYSYYASKQSDFGLYVFVYNPQQIALDTDTDRNKIQLRCGNIDGYSSLGLRFLNYSNAVGYEGRFYKFEIVLSNEIYDSILKALNAYSRVYEISGITLVNKGIATEYPVAQKYTYTGFAEGYGSDLAESDTLSCTVDGFEKYVELDVNHTIYRPEGDYYNGEQSQLNSVYFRVPERFFTDFGELTEIACEWYEYFTKPLLVSNDINTVNAINSLYGRNTMELPTDYYYLFMVFWENIKESWFKMSANAEWTSNRDYYGDWYKFDFLWSGSMDDFQKSSDFGGFVAAFYSNEISPDSVDRTLTGDTVLERLRQHSEKLGGNKIQDIYSEALFEDYVQSGYNRGYNYKSIKNDDKMEVFWNTLKTKTLWQKIFNGTSDVITDYDYLDAIKVISDSDITGSDSELSKSLYINEADISTFKSEYAKAKKQNERLVLFRFSTTKYMCAPAVSARCKGTEINSGTSDGEILANECYYRWKDKDWNCYVAQETVYLDFDIISLTYTNDDVKTEIPVVMTPISFTGNLTPPLKVPNADGSNCSNVSWKFIIGAIAAIFILIIFWPIISPILHAIVNCVVWVICLPFKAIGALFKGIGKAENKRKRGK